MRSQKGKEGWKGLHYARRLCAKAAYVLKHGVLPQTMQGKGAKHHSLLDHENIKPRKLCNELNYKIFNLVGLQGKTINHATVRRWLKQLGYTKHQHRKGIYVDGHECPDVVEYCNAFLQTIAELECFTMKYKDQTMEPQTFTGWLVLPADMISNLKQLGKWMRRLDAFKGDACKIIYPGANYNAWWDMQQLISQIEVAIDIFNILHPTDIDVFFFDCSSAHESFAADALSVQRMNVKPGGNQPQMHDTIIPHDCPIISRQGTRQTMVFTVEEMSDPGLIGVPKGMLRIFLAAANKGHVVGTCKTCKMSTAKRLKLEEEAWKCLEEDGEPTYLDDVTLSVQPACNDCCMSQILSFQSDFSNEKSLLQTTIEGAGHKCIFFAKISFFAKRDFSEVTDGTFATARIEVPLCLDRCTTVVIRRFFQKCYRYMDAYRKGLSGKQAEQAVKKYKSHQKVGQGIFMDINMITS
ncbi:hypothetical protein K439DRAFT_1645154 [Ramaria rubella]|nr:hypothetical protein K439DRAFT_1645154 [Ramaria rubella]